MQELPKQTSEVPARIQNTGPEDMRKWLRPLGTQDQEGLNKLGYALIQATARIRDGGAARPGGYRRGTHRTDTLSQRSLRLS